MTNQRPRQAPHATAAATVVASSSGSLDHVARDSPPTRAIHLGAPLATAGTRDSPALFAPAPLHAAAGGASLVVAGKRVYPCRVCGFHFSASSNRSRHERNKHGQPDGETAGPVAIAEQRITDGLVDAQRPAGWFQPPLPLQSEPSPALAAALAVSVAQESGSTTADTTRTEELSMGEDAHILSLPIDELAALTEESSSAAMAMGREDGLAKQVDGDVAPATNADAVAARCAVPIDELAEAAAAQESEPAAVPALLQDSLLQSACLPFLQWLCAPPITQVEALVKARRVMSTTQLQPMKLNLRFVFGLLLEAGALDKPELEALARLAVCQTLSAALERRHVGHGRVHALFLLVKKVLYLSSVESTRRRQFLPPTTHESFLFVESVCSDSSHRRKQEARNRAMLGVQTSKQLHRSQPTQGAPTLPPDAFLMPSMLGPSSQPRAAPSSSVTSPVPSPSPPPSHAASTSFSADSTESETSPNELTCDELKLIAKGALAHLQRRDGEATAYYVHHLVTATLCLGLAPRSQVLRQLRVGSSFVKEADGRYWVRMLADQNKNGRPTVFALPKELTEPFDHYLAAIRPGLLRAHGQEHDYVFCKKNDSAPRADFTELTATATQQLLGRPVNPHAFRSAVITAFYQAGATQSDMDVLASLMAHDSATARQYYFKPQMAKAAVETNDRMLGALDLSAPAPKVAV